MSRRRKIFLGIATLIALIPLSIVVLHFRAKWQLESYKKQLIAAGEKLEITELIPQKRAGSNSLPLFVEAAKSPLFAMPGPKPMVLSEKALARVAWRQSQSLILFSNQWSNLWPLLERNAETNKEALSRLRELLSLSSIYPVPDYERGFEMRKGGLYQELRTVAEELSTATLVSLHQGKREEALQNLRAAIAMERIYSSEPNITFQLSRSRYLQDCFALSWEALQYPDWTDEELGHLQRDWESVDLLKQVEPSITMDRAFVEEGIRRLHEGPLTEPVEECVCDGCYRSLDEQVPLWIWKWIWSYDEEQEILKFYVDQLKWIRAHAAQKTFPSSLTTYKHDWTRRLLSFFAPPVQRFCVKQFATQTEVEMVITAISLARFHRAEGRYPNVLGELIPRFLKHEPIDYCDGNSLRYRNNSDGTFALYSVGRNGIDNGGVLKEFSLSTIYDLRDCYDMVWPQARPDSEVQAEEEKKITATMAAKPKRR